MAHIEANNPNLSVEFHDREENVPAVVRSETSQDSVDLAQLVQSLINGEAFKSVMGHESLDAEYAPDDEASDAAQFARESAEKAYALHLERQQSAVTAPELNSAQTPDVSQTGETGITLPEGYTYAPTYSKLSFSAARNLRSTPSIDGARKTTLQSGELNAIEVVSAETDEYRWFYIPPVPGVEAGAFMGVQKVANPGVEIQSTNESVTPSAAATPPTTPEQTVIPPQAGTNEPPVLEATSTPELPGPGVAEPPNETFTPEPRAEKPDDLDYPNLWGKEVFSLTGVKIGSTDLLGDFSWRYAPSLSGESGYSYTEQSVSTLKPAVEALLSNVRSEDLIDGTKMRIVSDNWTRRIGGEDALTTVTDEEATVVTEIDFSKTIHIVVVPEENQLPGLSRVDMASLDGSKRGPSYYVGRGENTIYIFLGYVNEGAGNNKVDNFSIRQFIVPFTMLRKAVDFQNSIESDQSLESAWTGMRDAPWRIYASEFPQIYNQDLVQNLAPTVAPTPFEVAVQ